jgi:hypothetical protein
MNLPTLVLLAAPVILLLVVFRKRGQRSVVRSATVTIEADDHGVRRTLADGRTEEVAWSEVNEVDVFRTRVGPHKPAGGGVVLYGTAERGCIIPLDKLEASSLLVHIHHLPGFDVGALIRVVGADEDSLSPSDSATRFLTPKPLQTTVTCWTRTPPDAAADDGADDGGGDT